MFECCQHVETLQSISMDVWMLSTCINFTIKLYMFRLATLYKHETISLTGSCDGLSNIPVNRSANDISFYVCSTECLI